MSFSGGGGGGGAGRKMTNAFSAVMSSGKRANTFSSGKQQQQQASTVREALIPAAKPSSSAGGGEAPKDIKKSIWHMHRRMVAGTLIISLLLLYMLAIAVFTYNADARMFSFGWSNRIIETPGRDSIANMYRDNRNTSSANLDKMLKDSLHLALCRPVTYNGGLQWHPEEVSPTCNCIRNMHVEYVKTVTPMGVHLPEEVMNTTESKLNSLWISNRLRAECFQNLRHTQVEDISDPYNNDSETSFTNIVGVTVYWNVISCITASFIFYFDVMMQKEEGADSASSNSASTSSMVMQNSLFFVLTFLGLLWPMISLLLFCGAAQSLIMIIISVLFYCLAIIMHGKRHHEDTIANNRYPSRKKIVYWVGYTITAPALLMASNMLMQRRDVMYNFTTVFMVVCIGLCSLASEMIYTSYEHFYVSMYRKKKDQRDLKEVELAYDVDAAVMNFREQKNGMIRMNLVVTLLLVLSIGCTSFPVFSSTPFSNTHSAMFLALPLMLVIPPLITGRIISLVPSAEDADPNYSGGTSGQTWVLELIRVELLARAAFTIAVVYDLGSLSTADNMVVSVT